MRREKKEKRKTKITKAEQEKKEKKTENKKDEERKERKEKDKNHQVRTRKEIKIEKPARTHNIPPSLYVCGEEQQEALKEENGSWRTKTQEAA